MNKNSSPLRAAVIGFGRSGASMHGKPLRDLPGFELVAVADVSEERRSVAEEEFHAAFFTDYKKMLAEIRPDLTVVVTRNDQHAAMAIDCLAAGSHVLVTKPWALNAAEADRMVAAARQADRQVLPWLPMRFAPEALRIREIIRSGVLGDVFIVRRAISGYSVRADWQTEQRFGGGYLLNWGAHIVEPAYWVLDTRVRKVHGFLRQTIGRGDVEDLFHAELMLENGSRALVENTVTPVPVPRWLVQGTRGSLIVQGQTIQVYEAECDPDDLELSARDWSKKVPVKEWSEPCGDHIYGDTVEAYVQLGNHFCNQPHPGFDTEASVHLTRVLDAIRESNASSQVVSVPS